MTPSKEAMAAASEANSLLALPPLSDNYLAEIIDKHFHTIREERLRIIHLNIAANDEIDNELGLFCEATCGDGNQRLETIKRLREQNEALLKAVISARPYLSEKRGDLRWPELNSVLDDLKAKGIEI